MQNDIDQYFMSIALRLASTNKGCTAPNPSVGCVIVKQNKIIGQGFTEIKGRPHAEQQALKLCMVNAEGATAYITLEPCCFKGKTTSCAQLLIKAGIKRAVIALKDPDPRVNGKGVALLKKNGLHVILGIGKEQAILLYAGQLSKFKRNRPWITAKIASTLDGKIALKNYQSRWITGEKSRQIVHNIRKNNDAIISGINTIIHDNPYLNCRLHGLESKSPTRIICDSNLRTPLNSNLVRTAHYIPTIIATGLINPKMKKEFESNNIELWNSNLKNHKIDLISLLDFLCNKGFSSVLIEAGSTLTSAFLQLQIIDEIIWFHGSHIFGSDAIASISPLEKEAIETPPKFLLYENQRFNNDIISYLRNQDSENFIKLCANEYMK